MSHLSAVPSDPDELRAWLAEREGTGRPHVERRTTRKRARKATNRHIPDPEEVRPPPPGPRTALADLGVRPEAVQLIARLSPGRASRVEEWVLSATDLLLTGSDLEEAAAPYVVLLDFVGGGIELTKSGYLPPAVVHELCPLLEMNPLFVSDAARENSVEPLLVFRKNLQQAGLLHTSGGMLRLTPQGLELREDPQRLWHHVASHLPLERTEAEQRVGWLVLLALTGEIDRMEVYETVHRLCLDIGPGPGGRGYITKDAVRSLARPTQAALLGPGWVGRHWPGWLAAAAASAVFQDY